MWFQRHRAVLAAVLALVVGVWPGAGFAGAGGLSQEDALNRLGMYFHLPAEKPEVRSSIQNGKEIWDFSWQRQTGPSSRSGFVDAAVEKESGTIIRFYSLDSAALPVPPAKQVTEAAARQKAADLFKRLVPAEHQAALAPWKHEEGFYDGPFGQQGSYILTWVRQLESIPYPVDRVTIGVDKGTGEITNFMTNWTDQLQHGAVDRHLSQEEARKEFRTALGMEPFYQPVREGTSWKPRSPDSWVPAYRIRARVTEMDAVSGQFLGDTGKVADMSAYVHKPLDGFTGALPEALPLNAPAAEKLLHSLLGLTDEAGGSPYSDSFYGKHALRFSFFDPGAKRHGSAVVDLDTGLIRELQRDDGAGSVIMSGGGDAPAAGGDQQALDAATALVRSLYPTLKGSLGAGMVTAGLGPAGQTDVFFPRLHAGLPVGDEGLHVLVGSRGQWQSLHLEWSKSGPESAPAFVLTPDQAAERFFMACEPVLVWMPDMIAGFDPMEGMPPTEVRLTYSLLPGGSSDDGGGFEQVLDGQTGHFLDFQGRDISLVRQVRAALLAGRGGPELAALLDRGALSAKDGPIDPDRRLTRGEALSFLFSDPYGGSSMEGTVPYTDIPEEHPLYTTVMDALSRGVLTPVGKSPVLGPDNLVTRAEFALMAARYLGLGQLAKSDVQVVSPYKDTGSATPELQRAIAFLAGLRILDREEHFRPDHAITLAEAAVIALRLHPSDR